MKTYPSSKRDKLIVAIKEGSRYCSVVPSRVSWPCQGNRPQEGSKLHSGCRGRPSPNPAVLEEDTSWTGWLHHWIEVVSDQRCFIVYCLTLCFLIGSHSRRVKPLVSFQFQAFLNESPCHINSAWWVSRNESERIRIHSPLDTASERESSSFWRMHHPSQAVGSQWVRIGILKWIMLF